MALGEVLLAAVSDLEFRHCDCDVKHPFALATPVYPFTDGLLDKDEHAG